ncbi:hypothetical protein L2E82_13846 [Cichorium intybus]|uniref:Uncharacterized protein n=1 Tax=Cichorium intybus TaxID=13427 RepID=A0ACB9EZ53_CICIN|nr:hypothetical protein L2E82_13846 [Cichorium intybus]
MIRTQSKNLRAIRAPLLPFSPSIQDIKSDSSGRGDLHFALSKEHLSLLWLGFDFTDDNESHTPVDENLSNSENGVSDNIDLDENIIYEDCINGDSTSHKTETDGEIGVEVNGDVSSQPHEKESLVINPDSNPNPNPAPTASSDLTHGSRKRCTTTGPAHRMVQSQPNGNDDNNSNTQLLQNQVIEEPEENDDTRKSSK